MENTQLKVLYQTFDDTRRENGVEYWYARDLYPLLGYTRWDNFDVALQRAKEACKNAKGSIDDHFLHVQKKTIIGHGIEKNIDDIKLTRYACYLIALNSDPRKEQATIEEVYEPYLLQLGLLDRTSRGRVATKKAWKHFNIKSEGKLL